MNRKCDSNCKYSSTIYTCDSSKCGVSQKCGGKTYYCVCKDGKWQWSTTWPKNFCCSDNDCSGYDPDKHTELVCDSETYTCKPKPTCASNDECAPNYCCDAEVGGSGKCVQGIYSGNIRYLCDPPEWKVENDSTKTESILFSLILNFFSNLFS